MNGEATWVLWAAVKTITPLICLGFACWLEPIHTELLGGTLLVNNNRTCGLPPLYNHVSD